MNHQMLYRDDIEFKKEYSKNTEHKKNQKASFLKEQAENAGLYNRVLNISMIDYIQKIYKIRFRISEFL